MPRGETTVRVSQETSDVLGEFVDYWTDVNTKGDAIDKLLKERDLPSDDVHARLDELAEQVEENERHIEMLRDVIEGK